MRFAQEVGRPIVHAGEVYSGGEVIRDGRQTGFDLISNVKQISNGGSSYATANGGPPTGPGGIAYELTIHRMNCLPDPPEPMNQGMGNALFRDRSILCLVELEAKEIIQIQNKVVETKIDEAASNDQVVQIGEAVVPVQSSGYYYPVTGNAPVCFTADTLVNTPSGKKRMDQLAVGDRVESPEGNTTSFSLVTSFIHRLPTIMAQFIRLETDNGTVLKLSPLHFIHRSRCGSHRVEEVHAEMIREGDCLYEKVEDGGYKQTPVIYVRIVEEVGAYSPMTESGNIVVNGIMASCHNVIRSQSVSHSFFNFFKPVQRAIESVFASRQAYVNEEVHLPFGVDYILQMAHPQTDIPPSPPRPRKRSRRGGKFRKCWLLTAMSRFFKKSPQSTKTKYGLANDAFEESTCDGSKRPPPPLFPKRQGAYKPVTPGTHASQASPLRCKPPRNYLQQVIPLPTRSRSDSDDDCQQSPPRSPKLSQMGGGIAHPQTDTPPSPPRPPKRSRKGKKCRKCWLLRAMSRFFKKSPQSKGTKYGLANDAFDEATSDGSKRPPPPLFPKRQGAYKPVTTGTHPSQASPLRCKPPRNYLQQVIPLPTRSRSDSDDDCQQSPPRPPKLSQARGQIGSR
ncbi:CBN-WRT-1 protein [Aphelenchoides avenae]|nr:CBN-WRT-1 protein [Aphelenchus avenae]